MRPSIRFEVFRRDSFTCVYCGRKSPDVILEVDHVVPQAAGGDDSIDNLVTSCSDCNRGKAARPLGQPAPDLVTRTADLAERERQIAEHAQWIAAQRTREAQELAALGDRFAQIPGTTFWRDQEERWCWQEASVRTFLRRLGYHGVLEAIELTETAAWRWEDQAPGWRADTLWRYFCGCCWTSIKGPRV